jgi:MoaA/NifB/PqqE/SkfB family radical SAM enzyme
VHLEEIGFYTLSDDRCQNASKESPLQRCELILTDRCNFKCPYCRGLRSDLQGTLSFEKAVNTLLTWTSQGLKNVRFSGGEPTLYKDLPILVEIAKREGVEHIAISTNGSADKHLYNHLINVGVNDFSVSLDSGCCSIGDKMAGVAGVWPQVVENIKYLAKRAYVTVGMVFTEENIDQTIESINFAHGLGVSDIRIIPAAQYDKALDRLQELPDEVLVNHPILSYRVRNSKLARHVRGIQDSDTNGCPLVLDDMASANGYHFPCIIYMREGGDPIGRIGDSPKDGARVREERYQWYRSHNTHEDPICRRNCLDVCVDYNNRYAELHGGEQLAAAARETPP